MVDLVTFAQNMYTPMSHHDGRGATLEDTSIPLHTFRTTTLNHYSDSDAPIIPNLIHNYIYHNRYDRWERARDMLCKGDL